MVGLGRLAYRIPLAAALFCAVGCVADPMKTVESGWSRFKPKPPAAAPDVVDLQYIFIERELDSREINDVVWAEADEQFIDLERRNHLKANGFRIAKQGTRLSQGLQQLVKNANPSGQGRMHETHSGMLAKVQATDIVPSWSLFRVTDGRSAGETIAEAQGYLHVTPTTLGDSGVQLSVLPVLEYGQRQNRRVPAPDLSGWQLRNERDSRAFQDLQFELDLVTGEYLLIGCWPDRKGTLGAQYFTKQTKGKLYQTVLLIRVLRPSRDALLSAGYDVDDFFLSTSPKDAAGRSSIRETMVAAKRRNDSK